MYCDNQQSNLHTEVDKKSYGWSKKKTFAAPFQPYGFQIVPFDDTFFMSMLHGPKVGCHNWDFFNY